MKQHIAFIMPSVPYEPIGGFKVIYEYANRFVDDEYQVSIIYPAISFWRDKSIHIRCKAFIKYVLKAMTHKQCDASWFELDKRVKEIHVYSLNRLFIPNADIYIATAPQTAIYVNKYNKKKKKYYFLQHFENWLYSDEEVINTYRLPLHKIVISKWLSRIITKVGKRCTIIPNGFDFNYFTKDIDIPDKDKFCVTMMFHTSKWKGCADGFKALKIVKKRYPQLHVNLFSVYPPPMNLPDWYKFYQQPSKELHNRIYNEAGIFLGTSLTEGWGLTVGEAMICGCAVVCTDNNGYKEMASDNETALLSPTKQPQKLAENMIRLIEDDALRIRIAEAGNRNIQQFTWEKSYALLKNEIDKY